MSGEIETAPAMDDIEVNEMHVKVQGGPRHYVIATIPEGTTERWRVDHRDVEVSNGHVVGFVNDADAMHFIGFGRAKSLGRWDTFAALKAAYEAAEREEPAQEQEPVADAPRRRGRPPKQREAQQ